MCLSPEAARNHLEKVLNIAEYFKTISDWTEIESKAKRKYLLKGQCFHKYEYCFRLRGNFIGIRLKEAILGSWQGRANFFVPVSWLLDDWGKNFKHNHRKCDEKADGYWNERKVLGQLWGAVGFVWDLAWSKLSKLTARLNQQPQINCFFLLEPNKGIGVKMLGAGK